MRNNSELQKLYMYCCTTAVVYIAYIQQYTYFTLYIYIYIRSHRKLTGQKERVDGNPFEFHRNLSYYFCCTFCISILFISHDHTEDRGMAGRNSCELQKPTFCTAVSSCISICLREKPTPTQQRSDGYQAVNKCTYIHIYKRANASEPGRRSILLL